MAITDDIDKVLPDNIPACSGLIGKSIDAYWKITFKYRIWAGEDWRDSWLLNR